MSEKSISDEEKKPKKKKVKSKSKSKPKQNIAKDLSLPNNPSPTKEAKNILLSYINYKNSKKKKF